MTDPKPSVLVVEDEAPMLKFVHVSLEAQGYRVLDAETGKKGLELAAAHVPDLVLLDLGLPDMDGLEFAKRLREWASMPIVVLSARSDEEQKVKALDQGADDYLTKPFGAGELMARIRVALRHAARARDGASATARIGDEIEIDLVKRLVHVRGEEVHLTPIEYKLLVVLVKHAGMVVTHRQLLEQVWGPGHAHQMQYLRVYMTQLRRKLEMNPARPKYLTTEPGVGYRLRTEADG
jgi:two-component system, OmpR family, KDP operon response regulator KdpE